MTEHLLVDPELSAQLRAASLDSASALFALAGPQRSVGRFVEVPLEGTTGRFYLKCYRYADWRASRGLLGRGTLWGRAPEINEFHALRWLRAHGIAAVRPIAAAARTRRRRLLVHALLTEAIADVVDLDTRLHTPDDPLRTSRAARGALGQALGAALARMHAGGFVHGDCHARNVLVRMEPHGPRAWFLDCRRGRVGGWRRGPDFDLACLDRDLRGVLTRTERRRILAAYLDSAADAKDAVRRVAEIRDGLERRPPPPAV